MRRAGCGRPCRPLVAELRHFRLEAKVPIRFPQHHRIVDICESFPANGTAVLVMEYVEGLTLPELLRLLVNAGKSFRGSNLRRLS